MRADGVEEAAVICLAPQNSRTSVGLYRRAVQAEAGPLRIDFTDSWAAASAAGRCFRRAPARRPGKAHRGDRRDRFRCSLPRTACPRARSSLRRPSRPPDRVSGPAKEPIPMPTTPGAPPNWSPPAFPRSRNGGSPSRARAPAEAPGLAPPWRKRLTPSPGRGSRLCSCSPSDFSAITSKSSTT